MSAKSSTAAKNRWNNKNYDRIPLFVPKGMKETIKAHAQKHYESTNGFINRAIDETIARDEHTERKEDD